MGFPSLWPFIAFGLVTLLHYLSLKIQDRYQFYTKTFGKFGFWIHFILTFLLWIYLGKLLSGVSLPSLGLLPISFRGMEAVGDILNVAGTVAIIWSILILSIKRMWGVRYFERQTHERFEKRGPYRLLNNPMYNGFSLLFLASAFINNSSSHLFLSIESFVLFGLLSKFENKRINDRENSERDKDFTALTECRKKL